MPDSTCCDVPRVPSRGFAIARARSGSCLDERRQVYLIDSYVEEVDEATLQEAFSPASKGGAKGFHLALVQNLVGTDKRNPLQLSIWFQSGVKWQVANRLWLLLLFFLPKRA